MIDYRGAEKMILQKLRAGLPPRYLFHNWQHTWEVVEAVEMLSRPHGYDERTILRLKTACLFHDCGYLIRYQENEECGAQMAREILPAYGYTPEDLNVIAKLILATAFPYHPKGTMEELVCDADMYYVLTPSFTIRAEMLRHELSAVGQIFDDSAWLRMEYEFLSRLTFFTAECRQRYATIKPRLLEDIANQLKGVS